jgi:Transposase DDE domain group 1
MRTGPRPSRRQTILGSQTTARDHGPRRVVAKVELHPGELYPRVGFIVTNMTRPAERVVAFCNQRGTVQWIKEGKTVVTRMRLSCLRCAANAVRLQLHALAYNLANYFRTMALPAEVARWSMTTLGERLVKISAKIVRHGRSIIFQMTELMVTRHLFQTILNAFSTLRPLPLADAADQHHVWRDRPLAGGVARIEAGRSVCPATGKPSSHRNSSGGLSGDTAVA